jgi:hypothetical protein
LPFLGQIVEYANKLGKKRSVDVGMLGDMFHSPNVIKKMILNYRPSRIKVVESGPSCSRESEWSESGGCLQTILVRGATGDVGSEIVEQLTSWV